MAFITLTTDFGNKDGFVGTLKGVIWGICPEAKFADISHTISPQNVFEAAFIIWRAYSFFPAGTIHLAVVDPGVGTNRLPLAARLGMHYFVAPDNGLISLIFGDAERNSWPIELVQLDNPKYWLQNISHTFHGRDIFAPIAAYVARGVALSELGKPFRDPIRLQMPTPERTKTGWLAHITLVDEFGNLTTDLPEKEISRAGEVTFRLRGHEVRGIKDSYGHRPPGDLIALVDSENFVEIAIVNGSAAKTFGAQIGDIVEVVTISQLTL